VVDVLKDAPLRQRMLILLALDHHLLLEDLHRVDLLVVALLNLRVVVWSL
jgi:hypothetical protein